MTPRASTRCRSRSRGPPRTSESRLPEAAAVRLDSSGTWVRTAERDWSANAGCQPRMIRFQGVGVTPGQEGLEVRLPRLRGPELLPWRQPETGDRGDGHPHRTALRRSRGRNRRLPDCDSEQRASVRASPDRRPCRTSAGLPTPRAKRRSRKSPRQYADCLPVEPQIGKRRPNTFLLRKERQCYVSRLFHFAWTFTNPTRVFGGNRRGIVRCHGGR